MSDVESARARAEALNEPAGRALRSARRSQMWAGLNRYLASEAAWGQIVHIGNDSEETLIEDLARLVLKEARFEPSLERVPAPSGSVARRCPDISRLRHLTGFVPKVSLEAGVRDTFAWYREWHQSQGAAR